MFYVIVNLTMKPGFFLAILCNLIWSFSYVFQKQCATVLSADVVVGLRFGLAAVFLTPALFFFKTGCAISRKDFLRAALIGLICYTFAPMMQVIGIHHSKAGTAGILIVAEPIFSILAACLLLDEPFTRRLLLSIGCVICGVLILSGVGSSSLVSGTLLANLLILGSVLTEALQGPLAKGVLSRTHPLVLAFYSYLIGGIAATCFGLAQGSDFYPDGFPHVPVLALAFLCTTVAYSIWYVVLKLMPVSRAVLFIYLQPAGASLFAWLVLGESLRTLDALALGLIFAGILIGTENQAS